MWDVGGSSALCRISTAVEHALGVVLFVDDANRACVFEEARDRHANMVAVGPLFEVRFPDRDGAYAAAVVVHGDEPARSVHNDRQQPALEVREAGPQTNDF